MIYFFSGTSNSDAVARAVAETTGESLCRIDWQTRAVADCEVLGLVFPVHAWGMPRVVENFVRKSSFWTNRPRYVFLIMTCGDDTGLACDSVETLLQEKGIRLDLAWALQMPNTYVAFPFFDVDSPELERQKLGNAKHETVTLCSAIIKRESGIKRLRRGAMPYLKSRILRPLFLKLLSGDKDFTVKPTCTVCGKCSRICPVHNITIKGNMPPKWNGRCTDCLACYHFCPTHSIRKGAFSSRKGQYCFRDFGTWVKSVCRYANGR